MISTPPSPPADLLRRGALTLARTCAGVRRGEKAYVVGNPGTADVARYVADAARAEGAEVTLDIVEGPAIHGGKPDARIGPAFLAADVIFCLTSMSLAHSEERRRATDNGARYLSLPDYSLPLLAAPSLACDFRALIPQAEALGKLLDAGKTVRWTASAGSDVTFSIEGRKANRAPGCVLEKGMLGSPPDAEVNIAPIETSLEGVVVVDGSIPCHDIGLLRDPVTLRCEGGRIVDISGPDAAIVSRLTALFDKPGPKARVLGEFGIGLNPRAVLCGIMLEDEGCLGTVHFGFGSNATIGGLNRVPFHLDHIVNEPTVWIDGVEIMTRGKIVAPTAVLA
jgi:2,5-dihydroxypyridine 5,6-dioxygenase